MLDSLRKAITAHQAGNITEAEKLYREVLTNQPDQADALALLGVALDAKGDHAQAIDYIEKAIRLDPNATLFKIHLGNALMTAERYVEAAKAFREATQLQPTMAQAHYNLGNALRKTNDWLGAADAYCNAIRQNPNYAEAYNNLALALVHEKLVAEALQQAQKSVEIAPNYGEGWLTLCNIAEQAKNYELALRAGEKVIHLMPQNHKSWFGYGVALNRAGKHEKAIDIYKHALTLKPERADIWDNLGQTYQSLNRVEEAEAIFRKTVEVAGQIIPDEDRREVREEEYGNRHWHLALIELLRGKYKEGFARYRARFEDIGDLKRPDFPQPVWRGENLTGKTLLVCDEQGYGDTLMFCRYIPMLKTLGAHVIFSVHPVLKSLFEGWPAIDRLVVHDEKFHGFDYHCATFDLPHRFGTTLETAPADVPYLPVLELDESSRLETGIAVSAGHVPPPSRGRLGGGALSNPDIALNGAPPPPTPPSRGGEKKIGIVWGGSPLHKNDENRSIPLKIFADLFNTPNAQFYSLNRDLKSGDKELLPTLPVIDLAPRIKNFADAARFMQQLDLIITCDTATAHLAGGLGRNVWLLLPFAPDWRWMLGRDDSPWYPTMRLFRQEKAGEWRGVVANVKKALRD